MRCIRLNYGNIQVPQRLPEMRWLLLSSVLVLIVCYFINYLTKIGILDRTFDRFPGECIQFEGIDGSEDLDLMPNDHVLVSSGATVWSIDDQLPPHRSGIYMIDLGSNDTATKLVNITFEGSYRETNSPDFTPHGMGHWVTKDGEMILYVINHRRRGDTVDSFTYDPQKKSLKYRKSFENPLLYNQNDLVVVDLDKFYVTVDHYFIGAIGRTAEDMLKLPLGRILYVDGSGQGLEVKMAMNGVRVPNGIAMSNDNRLIFVNELVEGTVNTYTRNSDNTLSLVQKLPLHVGIDNVFVSPENGHLWVAYFVDVHQFNKYLYNHSEPMPGKIVHITIDQSVDLPFTDYKIEEVLSYSGESINGISMGLYHRGKLLLGTMRKDMWMCDVSYLMY